MCRFFFSMRSEVELENSRLMKFFLLRRGGWARMFVYIEI